MREELTRRGLLGLGAVLLAAGGAAAAEIAAIRSEGGAARLTLPGAGRVRHRLRVQSGPDRVVIDLPGHAWRGGTRLRGAAVAEGAVWDARRRRLTIDLSGPIAPPGVRRLGRDLVVTLRPAAPVPVRLPAGGQANGQARAATQTARRGAAPQKPLVVIDPGHGGKDPGAIGVSGVQEKRIVLAAALELKRRLEAGGNCRVALTRTRDVFVPLAERVAFARRRGAVLFLSVHADSAPGARGASVYTLSENASDALSAGLARRENAADAAGGMGIPSVPPDVQRILMSLVRQETKQGSARLAGLAVGALRPQVPLLPNTHRQAAFAVLKAPDIPSLLVEMGFLSSPADEAALRRPEYRARVAGALAGAVETYLDRPGVG